MTKESIQQWAANFSEGEIMMPEELNEAFVGIMPEKGGYVACYDYCKALNMLMEKTKMDEAQAVETLELYIANPEAKYPRFINKYEKF